MPIFILLILAGFLACIASPTRAADWLEWQSANLQLLHGEGFELSDNPSQTTLTFEYANGWRYGDMFFYVDTVLGAADETNAELSPRLSLGKITGADLSFGPVSDVLLTGTWEKARRFDAYLGGIAFDLDLPGFAFFQTNWYVRDNPDADGTGWQTTWVWSLPLETEDQKFTIDGYFDFADYEEGTQNFFTQPQFLWDAGHGLRMAPAGRVYFGLEYRYWRNKYGVEGVDESVPQAMLKWVL